MSQTIQTLLEIPSNGVAGNTVAQHYTFYQYTDVATSTQTTLLFEFRQDPGQWYLDDVSATTGGGANLLTDGGFENGLTGWVSGGYNSFVLPGPVGPGAGAAHSGTHYFADGAAFSNDPLSQTFATTIGTSYTISFYLANDGNGPALVSVTATGHAPAPVLDPGSDTGTPGDDITTVATPVLTGTGIPGDTITLFNGATSIGSATVALDNSWSVTASTLANGTYSLTTTETDASNATAATSVPLSLTIYAPPAPVGLTLDPGSDSGNLNDDITNDTAPVITGSATAGDTVTLYSGMTVLGSDLVAGDGTWSITSSMLSDGTYSLTALDTDLAGDVSAASTALALTIKTFAVAPTGLTLDPASDSGTAGDGITSVTTPIITGSATAGDTVTLYSGATLLGSGLVAGDGSWSITSSVLSNGTYSLTAHDDDVAGNYSPDSAPLALTIDALASAPTGLALAAGSDSGRSSSDDITNLTTLLITGLAGVGDDIALYDNGGVIPVGTGTVDVGGTWSITTGILTPGINELTATATNTAGAVSALSAALAVTVDLSTTTPTLGFAAGSNTTAANTLQPTLAGTAEAGAAITVLTGGTPVGSATADSLGNWSYQFAANLPDGLDAITATAIDVAGNASASSASLDTIINGTLDWASAVSGDFNTAGNWLYQGAATDAVPNPTDVAAFTTGSGTPYTVSGNGTASQVVVVNDQVSFTGTITTPSSSGRGGWSLNVSSGGTLTLGADGVSAAFLLLDGGSVQAPAGGVQVNAGITLTGGTTSTLIGVSTGTLTLAGEIDGAGGLLLSGGTIALTNTANSFTGGTTLSGATLVVADSGALGGGTLTTAGGTSNVLTLGSGSYTIASGGTDTIDAGSGSMLVTGGAGTMNFVGGSGPATVTGGSGGGVLTGGSGANLLIAGGGNTTLIGGSGDNTLVSQPGAVAFGGAGNATVFGAAAGGDVLVGGIAHSTLVATGGSEQLWAGTGASTLFGSAGSAVLGGNPTGTSEMVGGTGTNTFVGNGGNATMFLGSGSNLVFTGPGTTTVVEGSDSGTIEFGSGQATVWGGVGTSIDMFTKGAAGGTDVLAAFQPGRDQIDLFGYNPASVTSQSAGGDTVLALGDGTTVRLVGVASLPLSALHFGP